MNALLVLIPVALLLGAIGLAAFLWSMKSGQFDDLDGAAARILDDDDEPGDDRQGNTCAGDQAGIAEPRRNARKTDIDPA
jgi:cbb3-type cytochrome oxidase maturation protein